MIKELRLNKVKIIETSFENINDFCSYKSILIVTSSGFVKRGIVDRLRNLLKEKVTYVYDNVTPNPDLKKIEDIISYFSKDRIDVVLAIGGGSTIDTGKAIATGLKHYPRYSVNDFLNNKVNEEYLTKLPLIVIPTTSGTGSEVTQYATIWDQSEQKKYSLFGDYIFPDIALMDASLTLTLDKKNTLYPALDSISHALESIWNLNRNFISESYAFQSLNISKSALPIVLENPKDLSNRRLLQRASLLSGLAISQTQTALAHSISYPLTSYLNVPHGLAVSFTLEAIIDDFLKNSDFKAQKTIIEIKQLLKSLNIKSLTREYLDANIVDKLLNKMINPQRAGNFFKKVDEVIIKEYLNQSLT